MRRVSCLMVTLPVPDRQARMRRAIADYAGQSHVNRELIVVVDGGHGGDPGAVAAAIRALGRDDIRLVLPDGAPTLGALRNIAVGQARGDMLCQWDDDDRHHPDRIAAQLAAAGDAPASILQDVLLLDEPERALLWTNWAHTPAGGHPATLLCRRDAMPAYPESGPRASLREDLAVLDRLNRIGAVRPLADRAPLYLYVDHRANASPAAHHAMLRRELAISAALARRRAPAIRAGIAPFALGDAAVRFDGRDGTAFSLADDG